METTTRDIPSTQVSLGQKEKMKRNGNWDDWNLFTTMEVVGARPKIQSGSQTFNMHITSLHKHLYGFT
jgi:hypothetical protein